MIGKKCALAVAAAALLWAGRAAAEPALAERIDALMEARQWRQALPLAIEYSQNLAKQPGHSVADLARALHVAGSLQDRAGQHAEAVATFSRALELHGQSGSDGTERAACADEAGRAAQAAGDFALAVRWLREAVQGREKEPVLAALSRAQLSDALLKSGALEEAARELETAGKEAGTDTLARWAVARQRAVLMQALGRFAEALKALDAADEALGSLSGDDVEELRISLAAQRGQALFRLGEIDEAGRLLERAAAWFQARPEAPDEWLAQENNLAAFWLETGQADRACGHLRGVVESGAARRLDGSPALATPWLNYTAAALAAGKKEEARRASEETARRWAAVLPDVHPLRAQLALLRLAMAEDTAERHRAALEASSQARAWLGKVRGQNNEAALLEFRRTLDPISPLVAAGEGAVEPLADAVFSTQGAVLEEMLRPGAPSADEGSGENSRTWRETAASLPPGAVLVNYVWWRPLLAAGRWAEQGRYGALVLRAGQPPRWIDLGPAGEIDARVRRVIAAARDTVAASQAARHRASLDFQLGQLWEMAWAKIQPHTEGAALLVLRPDGMLHFAPWAILREAAAGQPAPYFCQRYPAVRVVARARPANVKSAAEKPAAPSRVWRVLAVPEAPGKGAPSQPPAFLPPDFPARLWHDVREMPALPGVMREVEAIRSAATPDVQVAAPRGLEAHVFPAPGEPRPEVLHFCGHGFALEEPEAFGLPRVVAGMVFGECAEGLKARAAGNPLPPGRDGLLFAKEVARADARGIGLAMLSGCQTGLGLWQPNEHLAGLRHAFILAGAEHVASTLWDVNDAAAPEFMRLVYARLAEGMAPSSALWSAQREWLEKAPGEAAVRMALAGAWTLEAAGW